MLTYSFNSEHPWAKNLPNELAIGCTGPRIKKKTKNNENKRTRKIVIIIVMIIVVIIVL